MMEADREEETEEESLRFAVPPCGPSSCRRAAATNGESSLVQGGRGGGFRLRVVRRFLRCEVLAVLLLLLLSALLHGGRDGGRNASPPSASAPRARCPRLLLPPASFFLFGFF